VSALCECALRCTLRCSARRRPNASRLLSPLCQLQLICSALCAAVPGLRAALHVLLRVRHQPVPAADRLPNVSACSSAAWNCPGLMQLSQCFSVVLVR
jgi:hypothetical protein